MLINCACVSFAHELAISNYRRHRNGNGEDSMMINKRLIGTVSESKKYIAGNVALQWCALAANIAMIGAICRLW